MVGFMGLIILILFLTTIFAAILFGTDVIEIRNDWVNRRCDPYVMFTAPLYQPFDDKRSSTEFGIDNFMFCLSSLSKGALSSAFTPLYEALKRFFSTITVIQNLMNSFRSYFSDLGSKFESIIGNRFQKFISIFDLFRQGIRKMLSAFSRNNAILIATLLQGMAGFTFIQNLVQFIIKVVIIIVVILASLVIFLFFIMFPVIPIIITTIGILTAAGLGAAVASYSGAFCLHPLTSIILQDGTYKKIGEINLGEILAPSTHNYDFPNEVYGILETEGRQTDLYEIDGIKMSGSHRVLERGRWFLAKDIGRAKLISERANRLYILNTRHHWLPTIKNSKSLVVSDWEEVSTDDGQEYWHAFVSEKLGASLTAKATSLPLIGESVKVLSSSGKKPISSLRIGDYVFDDKGKTRILAIYKGYLGSSVTDEEWLSDGNWVFDKEWKLYACGVLGGENAQTLGYQLITESGTFKIHYKSTNMLIRDFTECGIDNIEESYNIINNHII
jgi:hypothetical protein